MGLLIRRILAIISACGFATAVVVYIRSFTGTTMNTIFRWAIFLHIGIFLLLLPMYAIEYPSIKSRMFWKAFSQGLPKRAVRSIQLLMFFFIFHFLFFLVQSHASAPEIKNGEYILDDHGKTVRVLTESEYRSLKGSELRLFATGWMAFYSVPTMYWGFRRIGPEDSA
jgi:hypothetical protein